MNFLFTSESVSEGHPDKVCDQISDRILDLYLTHDKNSHVAAEVMATTNRIVIAGEVKSVADISHADLKKLAVETVKDIGYEQPGFDWRTVQVDVLIHEQSPEIAKGVEASGEKLLGAGDQGIMFGYACDETKTLMPAPLYYAHEILKSLADTRHKNPQLGLLPDSKSQVTLAYVEGRPCRAKSIVVSTQHQKDLSQIEIRDIVRQHVIEVLPDGWMCDEKEFYVNPSGSFVTGGPDGDVGLTGRKIIVDTYGGSSPHGGGAFSGKDPTKVDRSAAYMARYVAKNIIAAGIASRCTVQLSYAIGISYPLSVYVNTHATGKIEDSVIADKLSKNIDFSPAGILKILDLKNPIYTPTATYGHFGRLPTKDGGFSWERTDLKEKIQSFF